MASDAGLSGPADAFATLVMPAEEYYRLRDAWYAAGRSWPCSGCGQSPGTNPTCYGDNLCASCYKKRKQPVLQLYPGDRGYRPYFPSIDGPYPHGSL